MPPFRVRGLSWIEWRIDSLVMTTVVLVSLAFFSWSTQRKFDQIVKDHHKIMAQNEQQMTVMEMQQRWEQQRFQDLYTQVNIIRDQTLRHKVLIKKLEKEEKHREVNP